MAHSLARQSQAINIAQEWLKTQEQLNAEALVGGFSQATLMKVTGAGKVYVVRFLDTLPEQWRQNEITCQQIASDNGYGPYVYFTDRQRDVIVMEYLAAQAFPSDKDRLEAYIDLVKKIHLGTAFPVTYNLFEYTQDCLKTISTLGQNLIDVSKIALILTTIRQAVAHFPHSAPCHRDLHSGNVIYARGQLFAIDYTSAGQDDPYVDLAAPLFSESNNALLTEYLGRQPTEKELAKLSLMKSFVKVFYRVVLVKYIPERLFQEIFAQGISPRSYYELRQQIAQGAFDLGNPENMMEFALAAVEDIINYYNSDQFNSDQFNKEVKLLQEAA